MIAVGVVFLIKKFRDKRHLQIQVSFANLRNNIIYQPNKYPVNYNYPGNMMPNNTAQYQPPNIVQGHLENRQNQF